MTDFNVILSEAKDLEASPRADRGVGPYSAWREAPCLHAGMEGAVDYIQLLFPGELDEIHCVA